jgi:hypothetical protein
MNSRGDVVPGLQRKLRSMRVLPNFFSSGSISCQDDIVAARRDSKPTLVDYVLAAAGCARLIR